MKRFVMALATATTIGAWPAAAQETGVFRDGDERMTCAQIGEEAARLSATMGEATPSGGWLSRLGGLAQAGAALVVPGAGLAVAGAEAVRRPGQERAEAREEFVEARWYYLNGLHAGRGCLEQAEAASASTPTPSSPVGQVRVATGTLQGDGD